MASYFSEDLLQQRYEEMRIYIIGQWISMGAIRGEYYLQCPCFHDCYCSDWDDMPRIPMNKCLYPGELDQFFVRQPFERYGVKVRWHCKECNREMSCGFPPLGTE